MGKAKKRAGCSCHEFTHLEAGGGLVATRRTAHQLGGLVAHAFHGGVVAAMSRRRSV